IIGGALGGLLHAIVTVQFGVDQIISGVAINILAPAFARFMSLDIDPEKEGEVKLEIEPRKSDKPPRSEPAATA
ncbi:MAG: hypothetical protein ABI574_14710, partial [Burkholderiales bacterium]